MIRVVIENILLFLLPTVIYVTYVLLTRTQQTDGGPSSTSSPMSRMLEDAPLLWLFVAGAALVIVTLIAFGSASGGKPGQHYVPPSVKDGQIQPGRIE